MSTIKLQACDNTESFVEVEEKVARMSNTISNMLEDIGNTELPVPLHNINTKVLTKVVEYCQHYINCEQENKEQENKEENKEVEKDSTDVSDWDREFLSVDNSSLFELILAANFLDIQPLLTVTCKTVANMIKGKSVEEIRKTFNIKNDFLPEEELQVQKENEWTSD